MKPLDKTTGHIVNRDQPTYKQNSARPTSRSIFPRNQPERVEELNTITPSNAKVEIPDAVKDFSRIKKVVDHAEPLDKSRQIAALKEQIAAGTYDVDVDGLADKILEEEF